MLIYDDFRAENAATMRRVFSLPRRRRVGEVETRTSTSPAAPSARTAATTPSTRSRSARGGSRPRGAGDKSVTPRSLRRGAFLSTRRHFVTAEAPRDDPELMLEMRRRFKPEVVAASEYLDRDLVALGL